MVRGFAESLALVGRRLVKGDEGTNGAYLPHQHKEHHYIEEERRRNRQPRDVIVEGQVIVQHEAPAKRKKAAINQHQRTKHAPFASQTLVPAIPPGLDLIHVHGLFKQT